MHVADTTSVSATTVATGSSTLRPVSRHASRGLLSHHSSMSALPNVTRSSPPTSFSRLPTVSSLASAAEGAWEGAVAATAHPHRVHHPASVFRTTSQQELYGSLLRSERASGHPLRHLSRSSSSSSRDSAPGAAAAVTAATPPFAAPPPSDASLLPRSPPFRRHDDVASGSVSSRGTTSSSRQSSAHHHHTASPLRQRHADAEPSTMVGATMATRSSTQAAPSWVEEGSRGAHGTLSRHIYSSLSVTVAAASDSAAVTLLTGPPPPSGLRDPVTLLQLLPLDLLLLPTELPLHRASRDVVQPHQQLLSASERFRGTPTTPSAPSPLLSSNYRRAFSLLRCATRPTATLSSSPMWQSAASSLEATLGAVMTEIFHASHAGSVSLPRPAAPTPRPAPSAKKAPQRSADMVMVEGSVSLCSLASGPDGAASFLDVPHSTTLHTGASLSFTGVHDDGDDSAASASAADAAVVPLLFFAAVVECPPDIRRFLLLSRTHAYLCDADGTVAGCVAICEVRQLVTCAGGYMVWRFMPGAEVLTMHRLNSAGDKRRGAESAAAAATVFSPSPPSPLTTQRGVPSPVSPVMTPVTPKETRDEMSDWLFRIVSVGVTPPQPTAIVPAAASTRAMSSAHPESDDVAAPPAAAAASLLREDGLAEERMAATVFLVNVMCTLRTLPRLLMDAIITGSVSAAEGHDSSAPASPPPPPASQRSGGLWGMCGLSSDQLDRLHVPGDRPARVPLLLEGPVGHQTAVKFVEHYWTTRYDQLPPLLRPRRLSAAAGAPVESGRGARVCCVESSLHIPLVPVVSLIACLAAEDGVATMLETARDVATAEEGQVEARGRRGMADSAAAPAAAAAAATSTTTPCGIALKDMSTPAALADAQATLSPAAWRVLTSLLHPVAATAAGEAGNLLQDAPHRSAQLVAATALNTPTIPNTPFTRAHSERSLSSTLSASSGASVTPAAVEEGGGAHSARGHPISTTIETRHDAVPHPDGDNRSSSSTGGSSITQEQSPGVGVVAAHMRGGSAHSTTTTNEKESATLSAPSLELCESAGKRGEAGSACATEASFTPQLPSPTVPASADAKGINIVHSSSCCFSGSAGVAEEGPRQGAPTSTMSFRSATAASAARAVTAARLRRRNNAAAAEHTSEPVAAADAVITAPPPLPPTDVALAGSVVAHVPLTPPLLPPSPPPPPPPKLFITPVEAFERRIAHRPLRDRLVLRGRHIRQLLQPPLRSTSAACDRAVADTRHVHAGRRVLDEQNGHRDNEEEGDTDSVERGEREALITADPDRLVEDLRRQRVIAELMLLQQREEASIRPATAAAPTTLSPAPQQQQRL